MKKTITLVLTVFFLLCTVACSADNKVESPANFYYCTSTVIYNDPNGVISPELREIKSLDEDLTAVLNLYLQGPRSADYYNPFPDNTVIEAIVWEGNTLVLTVSAQYNQLSGLELTLASSCLAKTALELTGQQAVRIQCTEGLLDGNSSITLTQDDLLMVDMTSNSSEPTE